MATLKNPLAHLGGWHNIPKDIVKTGGTQPTTKNTLSISSQPWSNLPMYQGEPVWHSNSPGTLKTSIKEAFPDSTPWHATKIPSRPSGHYANWQPVKDRPGYFQTTMGYGNYGSYNWRVPGEFKTGKIDDYSGYGHNPTTGASWQYQLKKGIEDQDAWWGDRDAQDLLTFGSAGGRGDWEDNINYYGDEEDFSWYDFSAVDAARDKNYTAQEQLELLPENNNKDPWDTIGTYWSSLDASNPIPQGSATDFDRRDTDTWSDWMKSQPYSGFKNYWDYDRAATAYTKKQSAASEMYFDQDAGEWLLRTPDKYHSYNPGGSNYDPRFSMSFEQAKADKGWTSFVPQDHRSWKRGDKPLTPIPDRPIEIAHLEHKPDSRTHHTGVEALLDLEDAGGGLYDVQDRQWKRILGKDYVPGDPEENRRRWEDMHTRSGEHLSSNRYGTSGQTQTSLDPSDAWNAEKFLSMYGPGTNVAGLDLNNLGLLIGSPMESLGNYIEKRTRKGIGSGYDKTDFSPYIREGMAEQLYKNLGPWGFKRSVFDASSPDNAKLYDMFMPFPDVQNKARTKIEEERPVFIDAAYKASKIGKLQQEGKYLQMLIEANRVRNLPPQEQIKYFMKNVPQYNR